MGFYGKVTNTSKTQFTFDKIYSNRKEMDDAIRDIVSDTGEIIGRKDDGVAIGRYVLVDYDKDNGSSFTNAFLPTPEDIEKDPSLATDAFGNPRVNFYADKTLYRPLEINCLKYNYDTIVKALTHTDTSSYPDYEYVYYRINFGDEASGYTFKIRADELRSYSLEQLIAEGDKKVYFNTTPSPMDTSIAPSDWVDYTPWYEYKKLTNLELQEGPIEGKTYYTHNPVSLKMEVVSLEGSFSSDTNYYVKNAENYEIEIDGILKKSFKRYNIFAQEDNTFSQIIFNPIYLTEIEFNNYIASKTDMKEASENLLYVYKEYLADGSTRYVTSTDWQKDKEYFYLSFKPLTVYKSPRSFNNTYTTTKFLLDGICTTADDGKIVKLDSLNRYGFININYNTIKIDYDTVKDLLEPYNKNFVIDKEEYGLGRGYDSTVWTKVYENGVSNLFGNSVKYVMVAELNSVVPTFDLAADAPSLTPTTPHFDENSTNVYYKLHWQPNWGFKIKEAQKNNKGDYYSDGVSLIHSYTSDTDDKYEIVEDNNIAKGDIYFNKAGFNPEIRSDNLSIGNKISFEGIETSNGVTTLYYRDVNGKLSTIQAENAQQAINKYLAESQPGIYKGLGSMTNEIVVTASRAKDKNGNFLRKYNHDNAENPLPDTQELSIHLPGVGDAISQMWDVVYGNKEMTAPYEIDKEDPNSSGLAENSRLLYIDWEDGNALTDTPRLRLVQNKDETDNNFEYEDKQINTLAGAINSVHDLMGMIIVDEKAGGVEDSEIIPTSDRLSNVTWDDDNSKTTTEDFAKNEVVNASDDSHIYYNQETNKFYRKHKVYRYIPLPSGDGTTPVDNDYVKDNIYQAVPKDGGSWANVTKADDDWFYIRGRDYVREEHDEAVDGRNYLIFKAGKPEKVQSTMYEYAPSKYYYKDNSNGSYIFSTTSVDEEAKNPRDDYYILQINKYNKPIIFPSFYKLIGENKKVKQYIYYYKSSDGVIKPVKEVKSAFETWYNFSAIAQKNILYYRSTNGTWEKVGTTEAYNKNLIYAVNEGGSNDYFTKLIIQPGAESDADPLTKYNRIQYPIPGVIYYKPTITQLDGEEYIYDEDSDTYQKVPKYKIDYVGTDFTYTEAEAKLLRTFLGGCALLDTDKIYLPNSYQYKDSEGSLIQATDYKPIAYIYVDDDNAEKDITETPVQDIFQNLSWDINNITLEENYKEFLTTNNLENTRENQCLWLSNLTFYTLIPTEVGTKYYPNKYYYKVLDKNNKINYYRLSAKFEEAKKNDYYIINPSDYDYIEDWIYVKDKFYTQNDGLYEVSSGNFDADIQYYEKMGLYVISDEKHLYKKYSEWTNDAEYIPNDLVLGTREEFYEWQELEGFARTLNTIHGLILQINKILESGDAKTRNNNTVQGCINILNDIIAKFEELTPGRIMVVDEYGKVHGATYTTAQEFSYTNLGYNVDVTQAQPENNFIDSPISNYRKVVLTKDEFYYNVTKKGKVYYNGALEVINDYIEDDIYEKSTDDDKWISINIDKDPEEPQVIINHEFTKVDDTTTVSDMNGSIDLTATNVGLNNRITKVNNNNTSELQLYTPIVDSMGHVVGKNIETVTLPYGFKHINTLGQSNNDTSDLFTTTYSNVNNTFTDEVKVDIANSGSEGEADDAQDVLSINPENKWIQVKISDVDNDKITIAHEIHSIDRLDVTTDLNNETDEYSNSSDKITIFDVDCDNAGHLMINKHHTYTLPYGYKSFDTEHSDSIVSIGQNLNTTTADNTQDKLTLSMGNRWLESRVDNDKITIAHEVHLIDKVDITTDLNTETDEYSKSSDKITIFDVDCDNAGHLTMNKRHTYTLPYGYKSFDTEHSDSTTSIEQNLDITIADNSQDKLTLSTGNRWLESRVDNDKITIAHEIHWWTNNQAGTENSTSATNSDLNSVQTFPTESYTFDNAGHVINHNTHTYTLPNTYSYVQSWGDSAEVGFIEGSGTSTVPVTIEANASKDSFSIKPGNRWLNIKLTDSANRNSDVIIIAHNRSGADAILKGDATAQTPDYGVTFKVPYLGIDEAGHVHTFEEHTVTMPKQSIGGVGNVVTKADHDTANTLTFTHAQLMDLKLSTNSTVETLAVTKSTNPDQHSTHTSILSSNTLKEAIQSIPTMIDERVEDVLGTATPETLDTLTEIASWINANGADLNNYVSLTQLEKDVYGVDANGKVIPYNSSSPIQARLKSAESDIDLLQSKMDLVLPQEKYINGLDHYVLSNDPYDANETYYSLDAGIYTPVTVSEADYTIRTYYVKDSTMIDRLEAAEKSISTYLTAEWMEKVDKAVADLATVQQTTGNLQNAVDGYMKYHMGTTAPTDADGNTLTNAMWIDTSDPTNVLVKFPIPGGLDSKGNPIDISWIAINTWQ